MIKLFEQYKEYDQVKSWLDEMGILTYTINDDLTVDVDNNLIIRSKGITEIPVQFGKVDGMFDCSGNNLTSLKGSPVKVNWAVDCSNNKLTSLEYSPKYVDGTFTCVYNEISSLIGSPEYVTGNFVCRDNKLTSLKGAPTEVIGSIIIHSNPLAYEVVDFDDTRLLIKYQDEYGIWNSDNSFNKGRFYIFKNDYKNGLIK